MQTASPVLEQPQPAAPRTRSDPEVRSLALELPASTSPLRALKNRELAVLLAGAFVTNIGVWIGRVAVGVWAAETTCKAGATGAVTAMVFLPAVLGPVGGALSDRADLKRWLLRWAIGIGERPLLWNEGVLDGKIVAAGAP